jgi:hypothetical protein
MTMILVRKAHYELYDSPLHIVGENALDSTAVLANSMKLRDGVIVAPDFVNTQAIYARALTQGLAYPYMQPAVAQLFHQHAQNPEIYLAQVGFEHLPPGRWSFAEMALVVENDNAQDVLIGVLIDGVSTLAPPPSEEFTLKGTDYLILVTRKHGTHNNKDFMNDEGTSSSESSQDPGEQPSEEKAEEKAELPSPEGASLEPERTSSKGISDAAHSAELPPVSTSLPGRSPERTTSPEAGTTGETAAAATSEMNLAEVTAAAPASSSDTAAASPMVDVDDSPDEEDAEGSTPVGLPTTPLQKQRRAEIESEIARIRRQTEEAAKKRRKDRRSVG